ncbi:thiamine pyrophosphate-binding protein [Herbidospora sp. RD11066]
MTGAEAVAATLASYGVDTVFGIPGTHNLPLYDALFARGMRLVTPRHEQGAGYAADGYARISGRPGVVLTTTGPGILNAAAAAGQAYSDSVPMLLLSPGVPTTHPRRSTGYLHETKNQTAAMDAICAWSHRVTTVAEIPSALAAAFTFFAGGRPRPVHIEIPADLLDAPGSFTVPVRGSLTDAAAVLAGARRVGIVLGGGARNAGGSGLRLAETLNALVVTTINGTGILPPTHHRNLGPVLYLQATQTWLKSCDVLLAVGTELAPSDLWTDFVYEGTLIRIDLDPSQAMESTLPIVARAEDALPTLADLVESTRNPARLQGMLPPDGPQQETGAASTPGDPAAGERMHGEPINERSVPGESVNGEPVPGELTPGKPAREELPDFSGNTASHPRSTAMTSPTSGLPDPLSAISNDPDLATLVHQIADERAALSARWRTDLDSIAQALPTRTVIAADNSMFCYYGALPTLRNRFLFPTGFGTLGYALPAAIGAKVAAPDLPVLVLAGDGALQFTVQELATAVELGLNLPIVVSVNGGYGEIRAEMKARPMPPVAVDLHQPDFVKLAEAFGAQAVDQPTDLGAEIGKAFAADVPTVIVIQEQS